MTIDTTLLRKQVGGFGLGVAILAASSAALLLLLWISGHLSSNDYDTFLNQQEVVLRTPLWTSIAAVVAVPVCLIGTGKRVATITIAVLTLLPMIPLSFMVSMARF